jgi:hypothetical protein
LDTAGGKTTSMRSCVTKVGAERSTRRLFTFAVTTTLLLVTRDFARVAVPMVLIVGVLSLICLTMNDSELAAALMFLIPFENAIQITMIYVVALVIFVLRHLHDLRLNVHAVLILMCLMGLEASHMLIPPFDKVQYMKMAGVYSLITILIFSSQIRIEYSKVLRWFVFGTLLFSTLLVAYEFASSGYSVRRLGSRDEFELADSGYGLYNNPNAISIAICMSLSLCFLVSYVEGALPRSRLAELGMLVFYGILTLSKTFVVTLAFEVAYFLLALLISRNRRGMRLAGLVLIVLAVSFFLLKENMFVASLMNRFKVNLFSGRLEIIEAYSAYILSNPLYVVFGIGMQGMPEKTGLPLNPHNMLQEVVVAWGLVGLALCYAYVWAIYRRGARYKGPRGLIQHLPLLTLLFITQSSRLFRKLETFSLLFLVFCAYRWFCQNHEKLKAGGCQPT